MNKIPKEAMIKSQKVTTTSKEPCFNAKIDLSNTSKESLLIYKLLYTITLWIGSFKMHLIIRIIRKREK